MFWVYLMGIVILIGAIWSICKIDFDIFLGALCLCLLLVIPLMLCCAIGQELPKEKVVSQENILLTTITTENNINFTIKIDRNIISYYDKDLCQQQVTFNECVKIIPEENLQEGAYLVIKECEYDSKIITLMCEAKKTFYEFHVLKDNIFYIN